MFLERSLNDPPPPNTPLKASFTATPSPSTTLSLPKNFDRTLSTGLFGWCSAGGGVFSTPSQTTLSLKLDYSNFVQNYFGIMYQSILSLTTPWANPLEILLKWRIPHSRAQKSAKPQPMRQINRAKIPPPGQLFLKMQQNPIKPEKEIVKNSTQMLICLEILKQWNIYTILQNKRMRRCGVTLPTNNFLTNYISSKREFIREPESF